MQLENTCRVFGNNGISAWYRVMALILFADNRPHQTIGVKQQSFLLSSWILWARNKKGAVKITILFMMSGVSGGVTHIGGRVCKLNGWRLEQLEPEDVLSRWPLH